MNRIAQFSKVSFDQFYSALSDKIKGLYYNIDNVHEMYDNIKLPTRATSGSAGYDFKMPFDIRLKPGETIKIPTGIRAYVDDGWWMGCLPRSGLGFKYRLQLDNTMGVIDSDYYFSDNEGHIFAKITNDGKEGKDIALNAGDGFMQAIFIPYGITFDDDVTTVRNGGMGSTGK
jgi:dUTP pyrophosphatase